VIPRATARLAGFAAVLVLAGLGLLWIGPAVRAAFRDAGRPRITQGVVLERLRTVAKLATTEVGLRDVVTYEQTRLGSTKKALVVVTGKALVGFDLADHAKVDLDPAARRVRVVLPRASLIAVDITDLKTYDEKRGLWNPFRPADRDTIFLLARAQLMHAARDLAVLEHAERGARQALAALLGAEGYQVDVELEPFLLSPPPAETPPR
jgi:hypothetical protein